MSAKKYKHVIPGEKIIYIVEDNDIYAKSLQSFLLNRCPDVKEIKTFRIGEMCLMELHHNPAIIIMDYFLNSKYEDAHSGLDIVGQIKALKPYTKIIMLSVQKDIDIVLEAVKLFDCIYVQKDDEAFNKVEKIVKNIFNEEGKSEKPWN